MLQQSCVVVLSFFVSFFVSGSSFLQPMKRAKTNNRPIMMKIISLYSVKYDANAVPANNGSSKTRWHGHVIRATRNQPVLFIVFFILFHLLFLHQCFNNRAFVNIFVFGTSIFKIHQYLFNSLKIFNFTLDVLYLKNSEIIHITALGFVAIDDP